MIGPRDLTHEEFRVYVRRMLPDDCMTIITSDVQEDGRRVAEINHRATLFCRGSNCEISAMLRGPSAIGIVNQLAALIDALYLTGMDLEDWRSENGLCPRCGEPVEGTCGDCFGGRDDDGYSAHEWAEMNDPHRWAP